MKLRELAGAGDRIGLAVLPFAVIGLVLNFVYPEVFEVGGPTEWLRILSIGVLAIGVVVWAWSVVLIVARVPRGELTPPVRSQSLGTRSTRAWRSWYSRGSASC